MKTLSKKKRGLIFVGALILMTMLSWYSSSAMPNSAEQEAKYDTPPQLIGGFKAIQQNLVYPEKAKKAGVQGKVVLNVTIDENGQVRDVKTSPAAGEDKSLVEEAIAAVKATKWQSALLKGKPVAATVTIPVEFKLDDGQKAAASETLKLESPAPPPPHPDAPPPPPGQASSDIFQPPQPGAEMPAPAAESADVFVPPLPGVQEAAPIVESTDVLRDSQLLAEEKAAASADRDAAIADQAAAIADQRAASVDQAAALVDRDAALADQDAAIADRAASADYDQPPSPVGGFTALVSGVVYPEIAQKAGIQGKALVNVLIDEKGNVVETKVLKAMGNADCDAAAVSAIRAVKWNPARKGEKAVKAWVTIPIEFKLK